MSQSYELHNRLQDQPFGGLRAGKAGHVIAVEPDDRMRSVLQDRSPGIEVLAGRGEAIPLPDASADAVLVSSAWHWMDPELAVPEIARVLRDHGRFGLLWTSRDQSARWIRAEDWVAAEDQPPPDNPAAVAETRRPVPPPALEWDGQRGLAADPSRFKNIETAACRFSRWMTPSDLADMLTTYSRIITAGPDVRAAGRARAAAALAAQFPGASEI